MTTNFQLLMLSPNLLKSQVPLWYYGGGGVGSGVGDDQFQTFDAESSPTMVKGGGDG